MSILSKLANKPVDKYGFERGGQVKGGKCSYLKRSRIPGVSIWISPAYSAELGKVIYTISIMDDGESTDVASRGTAVAAKKLVNEKYAHLFYPANE